MVQTYWLQCSKLSIYFVHHSGAQSWMLCAQEPVNAPSNTKALWRAEKVCTVQTNTPENCAPDSGAHQTMSAPVISNTMAGRMVFRGPAPHFSIKQFQIGPYGCSQNDGKGVYHGLSIASFSDI